MSNTTNKESLAYQNKKKYIRNYNMTMVKRIAIGFNINIEEDMELLEYLHSKGNVQGFIKELIREQKKKDRA